MPKRNRPQINARTPIGRDVELDHEDVRLGDGTRLTEAVAAEIVVQVRRGTGRRS